MINQTNTLVAMFTILTTSLFVVGIGSQYVLAQVEINPHGASQFAPGINPDTASANSPGASEKGIEQHGRLPGGGCLAAIISPGHMFKLEPPTTDTSP